MTNHLILAEIRLVDVLQTVVIVLGAVLVVALLGLALLWHRLRRIELPPDAGVMETLRAVPISLVVLLDMLDLSLDFFSAPISWAILSRLRLQALRQVTVMEAIIPGTQLIPTMTLAWLFARFTQPSVSRSRSSADEGQVIDHEPSASSRQRRLP